MTEAEYETFLWSDPTLVLRMVRGALVDRLNPWMTAHSAAQRGYPKPLDPALGLRSVFRADEELAQLVDALAYVIRLLDPGGEVYMPRASTKESVS